MTRDERVEKQMRARREAEIASRNADDAYTDAARCPDNRTEVLRRRRAADRAAAKVSDLHDAASAF